MNIFTNKVQAAKSNTSEEFVLQFVQGSPVFLPDGKLDGTTEETVGAFAMTYTTAILLRDSLNYHFPIKDYPVIKD